MTVSSLTAKRMYKALLSWLGFPSRIILLN